MVKLSEKPVELNGKNGFSMEAYISMAALTEVWEF